MHSVIFLLCFSTVFSLTPETAHIHINQQIYNCRLPDILPIQIHIEDQHIDCDLQKNSDVGTDVPMFTLQSSPSGQPVVVPEQSQTSESNNTAYQNTEKNIALVLKCSILNDGVSSLTLEGSITFDGKEYIITKSHRHRRQANDSADEEYILHKQKDLPQLHHDFKEASDYMVTRKEVDPFRKGYLPLAVSAPRFKRATTTYNIDVVMVIDYSIYSFWYLKSKSVDRKRDALNNIRLYYAIVANGMNLRYKSIEADFAINVRLSSLIIAETPGTASWTENVRQTQVPRDEVDSDIVLESFKDWVGSADSLPQYDHMMLLTRYNLYSETGGIRSNSTAGLAFIGAICDTRGQATSVVEDEGGYQCTETAAHELGHSLGAKHDGMSIMCSDSDRYIMTAGSYRSTPQTKTNPWKFSSCSIEYFRDRLARVARTSRGRQCLYNSISKSSNIPEVSKTLPGQLHTPDQICQQIYGPASRMCKGVEFGKLDDICTSLFCLDPYSDGSCYKQVAPRGLSCGNNKWCIDGECKADFRAPDLDETCPFGNVVGTAFNGSTCEQFVSGYPAYCYQELVKGRCCQTCSKHYIGVYGCEYGDKGYGCNRLGCGRRDTRGGNYSATCCGTCNYRIEVPGGIKTTTRQTLPPRTQPPQPTTSQTQPPATCVDVSNNVVGDSTCQELVPVSPELCYHSFISTSCCRSCQLVKTNNPYCPYGDSNTACNKGWCGTQLANGSYYDEKCCQTCKYNGTPPTRPTFTSTTLTSSTTTSTTPSPTSSTTAPTSSTTPSTTTTTTTPSTTTTTTTPSTTTTAPATTTTPSTKTIPSPTTSTTVAPTTNSPCKPISEDQMNSCRELIASEGIHSCYNTSIQEFCCQSCLEKAKSIKACEYGDKSPENCMRRINLGQSCANLTSECCESCKNYFVSDNNSPVLTLSWTMLVLLMCSVLYVTF
ncbi:hypothetical protein LOTGIDRAFT_152975 [Lottia gigantea]|uniref:Peptidase M12B domain-containing protein n=1 Tax=Lottia gigantea TaxID=225164 RepID=V4A220_LOTGI|nr:hypothetical protein LOTGIDRAFT_152975 [Lottia gigantea]ESO97868.1 hypothetical protein LOTGIDRAFT_152975 [Lottia gigantea]